ncbi:MAG TPA: hypothetical protein VLB84_01725 [Bacteroidia bacterium]|jgi:hypothetical protein|nr:hypothetical protein [Bacteroidia bacterium]
MKKSAVLLTFFTLFLFVVSVKAQQMSPPQQKKVNDLFKNKSVLYFEFTVASSQEIASLAKIVSIDGVKGTKARAHATKDQFSKFIVKNYPYTVLPTPAGKAKPAAKTAAKPAAKKKTTATKK